MGTQCNVARGNRGFSYNPRYGLPTPTLGRPPKRGPTSCSYLRQPPSGVISTSSIIHHGVIAGHADNTQHGKNIDIDESGVTERTSEPLALE